MNRRGFLALSGAAGLATGLGAALAAPARAHTPYGQWVVYRKKHLLIGSHRGDMVTYDLARLVVAGLERELPTAKARVARGPRPQRIASLIGTGQLFLTVLSRDEAERMARAEAPFEGYSPTPVHAVASLERLNPGYMLFAAPEFPQDHSHLVTEAIDHSGIGTAPKDITLHAGAEAYWQAPSTADLPEAALE